MANFMLFVYLVAFYGTALFGGVVRDGRYFITTHGKTTELTAMMYSLSWWQAVSGLASVPLGMFVTFLAQQK